ncbi:hypothetical protein ACIP98_07735 [Streptomyces sp. NPDC088354]|uniref:hypothetical protein n=1 Tax=unclassified Streptomyces TaxID=2593676 RepID=UPI0029B3A41F|nr:hypothetical protein [Streptomyces sp. MI02-7b]MDX3071379.1 hypothetical protein [Streptomyces sp. MI02-7b]
MTGGGTIVRGCARPGASGDDIVVDDVDGPEEMASCMELYADVMGLRPGDGGVNPRLLTALQANSGLVVDAHRGRELVGFAYSFLAREPLEDGPGTAGGPAWRFYQYSQLAVVARAHQGKGIGRRLKHAQRDRCLAEGITLMRWTFDPVKTRNAHFNLDVLGGRLTAVKPAMYGPDGFGDDTGEVTDRFLVDWHLTEPPRAARPLVPRAGWRPGTVHRDGEDVIVVVPAQWQKHRAEHGAGAAADLRRRLCETFGTVLTEHEGVSCRRLDEDLAAYRFVPRRAD